MTDPSSQTPEDISSGEIHKDNSNIGESFIGVWLDENSKSTDSDTYVDFKHELENTFDFVPTFIRPWECIKYLMSIKDGKILFLISHQHADVVMKLIENENLPQIHSIYIICSNALESEKWNLPNFKKLRGAFVLKNELIKQIKNDIKTINVNNEASENSPPSPSTQESINERTENAVPSINVFNSEPKNNSIQHLNKDSIWFIRYQLFFKILLELEKSSAAADEMIYVCRRLYQDDPVYPAQINEFEKDVNDANKSVYWYTKASFVVHLLNKRCGSENFHDVYPFRLFIRNLHSEIVQLDENRRANLREDTITVFRGKYIAFSTFEKLKKNKNGLVAMNGFLSTTRKEDVARFFVSDGAPKIGHVAVLFKLNIDTKVINKPYSDVPSGRHGVGPDEEELLFSLGSVWRIIDVYQRSDINMWCVELTLSNQDDEQSKLLADYQKREIGEEVNNWTLGDFLTKTRQYEQAETYYDLLKSVLPNTAENLAVIENRIAYVRYEDGDYKTALTNLQKAMTLAAKDSEATIIDEFRHQTTVIETSLQARYAPALRRQLENDDIILKYLLSNPVSLPIIQNNFGCIYQKRGLLECALRCYDAALKILLRSGVEFLPEISAIYNNIGTLRCREKNYQDATTHFRRAITTLSNLGLDPPHRWISEYDKNYKTVCGYTDSNKSKRPRT